jgi:hypothetical protein
MFPAPAVWQQLFETGADAFGVAVGEFPWAHAAIERARTAANNLYFIKDLLILKVMNAARRATACRGWLSGRRITEM